jgi:hypothetical protein
LRSCSQKEHQVEISDGKEEKVKTEKIAEVKGASLRPAYSSSLLLLQRVRLAEIMVLPKNPQSIQD